jgi:hypothetical protein
MANNRHTGIGLGTIIFIIFLILKLCEIGTVATWSWWWVTSPLWISIGLWVVFLVLTLLFLGLISFFELLGKK